MKDNSQKRNARSAVEFPGERRIHVGLAVADLDRSRRFYQVLLGVAPSKEQPGYVKFEPTDPSVNLSLNEVDDAPPRQGMPVHYGIQVKSAEAVSAAAARLQAAGIATRSEESTTCCYAVQDKVWAIDPDGNNWEVFVVLDNTAAQRKDEQSACCAGNGNAGSTACC